MKTGAEKSSTTSSPTATHEAGRPFFSRRGEGDFFAARGGAAPAVQMKMTVNQPGDHFEQEAEKMSERVMRLAPGQPPKEEKVQRQPQDKLQKAEGEKPPAPATEEERVQRQAEVRVPPATPETKARQEEDERRLKPRSRLGEFQRKESGGAGGATPSVSPNVQSAIKDRASGGEPLSSDVRSYMEPRFGADFSNVRIHKDPESAALNDQLSARAFTYQNHVFFSRDRFQPDTGDGKQLLAHELTHTIQQGHAVQRRPASSPDRREDAVQRETGPPSEKRDAAVQKATKPPAAPKEEATSSEVVDLSTGVFSPSGKVSEEILAQSHKGLAVRVKVKGVTGEGRIKVRADKRKNYHSIGRGSMPVTAPWAELIGGVYINFTLVNSEIKGGYASLKPGGGNTNDWLQSLQKNAAILGGLGLKVENLPRPVNKFESGKLTLGVTNLKVEVGGYVDAVFSFSVEDAEKPKIEAAADINIKGMAKGQFKLDNTKDKLAGELSLAIAYKSFNGSALMKYNPDGTVDLAGKAHYDADRLSGEINFVSTDLETANNFTKDAIKAAGGKEKVQDAPPPAPVPPPKAGKKKRGLAAAGLLSFHLTDWFAGTVFVVVDSTGNVTVIGRIAPPAEVPLMKTPREWDKELISFEAKAYYGLPVVGDINIFGSLSLHALATLGPAKIYNIEILGTYSTDPEVQKMIQISGSINISGYSGLRFRAEGGAGIEIMHHDIKFGIGVNADIGVKAYADARPTIGYRDPGIFYISGTLDLVAQPMFGLGGDFFIALETPWWSPLSDDRWTWPLFKKEWPLGDPIGLSAVMKEYQLGSGKVPEIELKKPEFDPSKFMSKMVDNDLPDKSGKGKEGQGSFKDDGTIQKPEVPPKKPEPKKGEKKELAKKGAPPKAGKSAAPDPNSPREKENAKILQNASKPLSALKEKGPLSRGELDLELGKIKTAVSGLGFDIQVKGENWVVRAKAGVRVSKGVEVKAKDKPVNGAARPDERTAEQQMKDVHLAAAELEVSVGMAPDREAVKKHLARIKIKFKLTDLFIEDLPHGAFDVVAVINPRWKTKTYPPGESKYVFIDPADNRRKLREQYRGSFKVRTSFYLLGQGYGTTLDRKRDEKVAARSYRLENGDYVKDPAGDYWIGDPSQPARIVPKKSPTHPTVEHPISVRDHWNTEGKRIDQPGRRAWVTFKGKEDDAPILDFQSNRSAPSASQEGYTEIVESTFKGPGEK